MEWGLRYMGWPPRWLEPGWRYMAASPGLFCATCPVSGNTGAPCAAPYRLFISLVSFRRRLSSSFSTFFRVRKSWCFSSFRAVSFSSNCAICFFVSSRLVASIIFLFSLSFLRRSYSSALPSSSCFLRLSLIMWFLRASQVALGILGRSCITGAVLGFSILNASKVCLEKQ